MPNPGHRVNSGALDVRVKSVEVDNNEAKLMVDTLNVFNTNLTGGEGVLFIQASKASGGGYWFVTLFAIRGRAFATWPMIIYTAYAAAITIFFQIKGQTQITQNANMWSGLQTSVSLVGIALFFLQTFRTNSAYQRWWEGRCLWDSVNTACYSMARITQAGGISSKKHARRLLRWMCGYLVTLKAGLRDEEDISELYPILSNTELEELEEVHCTQRCVYTVQKITETWLSCQAEKKIGTASDKEFEKLVPDLMRCCGSMERIMHTPMPFAYITHLRSFLVIWLSVLPFIFMINLKYYTIGVCFVIAYALLGMEALILEIETPFGRDFNDLPSDNYIADAVKTLLKAYVTTQYLPATDGTDGDGPHGLQWEDRPGLAGAAAQHAAATAAGQAV